METENQIDLESMNIQDAVNYLYQCQNVVTQYLTEIATIQANMTYVIGAIDTTLNA